MLRIVSNYGSYSRIKKVKLSLEVLGVEMQMHVFVPSALDGDEFSASRPGRFTLGKESPIPIGYEAEWASEPCLDILDRNILSLPGIKPRFFGRPARSPSLYRLRYPGLRNQQVPGSNMEWGCSLSWLRSVVNDNTLGLYAGDT
jgi:hypothetical protein